MAAKRRRKTAKRKPRPMKPGECRTTRAGMEYCKMPEGVRFTGQTGSLSGRGRARRKSTKGKSCVRFKRVPMKGTTGKVRRCAEFK